eukprot:GHVH01012906.1.p1 GENE.GHVH01012906.1~~GHVH01012906.1.p1  ORF type:complete len:147 (+),score=1.72 GHVH01012906.1:68-442(+)
MRQYIVCTLGVPLLVICVWFTVFGLFGMNAQDQWVNPNVYPGLDEAGMSQIDWNDLSKQPVENMLFLLYFWCRDVCLDQDCCHSNKNYILSCFAFRLVSYLRRSAQSLAPLRCSYPIVYFCIYH